MEKWNFTKSARGAGTLEGILQRKDDLVLTYGSLRCGEEIDLASLTKIERKRACV